MEIEIRGKEPRAIGPNRSPQRRLDFRALGNRGHTERIVVGVPRAVLMMDSRAP